MEKRAFRFWVEPLGSLDTGVKKTAAFIRLARPHQYIKNGFILLPLFFGDRLFNGQAVVASLLSLCVFSLLASAVYAINDFLDRDHDRCHPHKKTRPLASAALTGAEALVMSMVLLATAAAVSLCLLPMEVTGFMALYLLLNLAYSWKLKQYAIIDICCIATGFVLRIAVGAAAAAVAVSQWIVIMTFLLALFLGLAKRRDDLLQASGDKGNYRESLDGYSLQFVSYAMAIMASVIIVAYVQYTTSAAVIARHGTASLYISGLWVVLGLLKYLQIVFVLRQGGSPTRVLLKSRALQAIVAAWLVHLFLILYAGVG